MSKPYAKGLFVFQRDLRLVDQRGLSAALSQCESLYLIGIFDPERAKLNLETLSYSFNMKTRLSALYHLEAALKTELSTIEVPIKLLVGDTVALIKQMVDCKNLGIEAVFANTVMEPAYLSAYQTLSRSLPLDLKLFKDHEVLSESILVNQSASPYKVFTPFYKLWRKQLNPLYYGRCELPSGWQAQVLEWRQAEYDNESLKQAALCWSQLIETMKNANSLNPLVNTQTAQARWLAFKNSGIEQYDQQRDYPALEGTSNLSLYINNGLISYRQLVRESLDLGEEAFLRQLAWRHFYQLILFYFPRVEHEAFLEVFKELPWENDDAKIEAWKNGATGFPIVDAAMRELKATGRMHNRLRMIVASFLVKHLDVNWQVGEAYFYELLEDGDLALNNGGWQWSASTGNDAQPYFRIFNPLRQAETYDPEGLYQNKWLSLDENYEAVVPIVDLKREGQKALLKYKLAKKGSVDNEDNVGYK